MSKLKNSKIYKIIITSIVLFITVLSTNVYATKISTRYTYNSSLADDAFGYGEIYDKNKGLTSREDGIKQSYVDVLYKEMKPNYWYKDDDGNEQFNFDGVDPYEGYIPRLIRDLKEIKGESYTYTEGTNETARDKDFYGGYDECNGLEKEWINAKINYAKDNYDTTHSSSSVYSILGDNNSKDNAWVNSFYNRCDLFCFAWGKPLSTHVEFKKVTYEYATPSMAFLMNLQADVGSNSARKLKNDLQLFDVLTNDDNQDYDLNAVGKKEGMLGNTGIMSEPNTVQNAIWSLNPSTEATDRNGFLSNGQITAQDDGFISQQAKLIEASSAGRTYSIETDFTGTGTLKTYTISNDVEFKEEYCTDFPGESDTYFVGKVSGLQDNGVEKKKLKLSYTAKVNESKSYSGELDSDSYYLIIDSKAKIDVEDTDGEPIIIKNDDTIMYRIKKPEDGENYVKRTEVSEINASLVTKYSSTVSNTLVTTALDNITQNYENFIKNIADLKDVERTDENGNKRITQEFDYEKITCPGKKDENGNPVKFKFPKIDEKKITKILESEIEVGWDTDNKNFRIGPMTMGVSGTYLTIKIKDEDTTYDFGYIDDLTIKGKKNGEEPQVLVKGRDWQYLFNDIHGNEVRSDEPPAGTPFYIVLKDENLTEITEVTYNYKYLVCVANYFYFTNGEADGGIPAQEQAMTDDSARWYESVNIPVAFDNNVYIPIEKKVVDENNNELSEDAIHEKFGKDLYADFEVKICESGSEVPVYSRSSVNVKAGATEPEKVGPFALEKDKEYTYTVTEIDSSDYWNTEKIEKQYWVPKETEPSEYELRTEVSKNEKSISGNIKNGDTVKVVATNKLKPHRGKIKIVKTTDEPVDKDTTFKFRLSVIDFEKKPIYGDIGPITEAENPTTKETDEILEVKVLAGQSKSIERWCAYTWYGDEAPTYTLEEVEIPIGYEVDGPNPIKGTLSESSDLVITAKNKKTIEPVKLTLQKDIDQGMNCNGTFDFRVKFYQEENGQQTNVKEYSGDQTQLITPNGNVREFYYWAKDATKPVKYEVEEIPNEKTELVSYNEYKDDTIKETIEYNKVDDGTKVLYKVLYTKYKDDKTTETSEYIIDNDATKMCTAEVSAGEQVKVTVVNRLKPNTAKIVLDKSFTDESYNDRIVTFKVDVAIPKEVADRISKEDKYPNTNIPDDFVKDEATSTSDEVHYVAMPQLKILKGETKSEEIWIKSDPGYWYKLENEKWDSGDFKWYGDYNLRYNITEEQVVEIDNDKTNVISDEYNLQEIDGTLDGTQEVHCVNKPKYVKLKIEKKLEGRQDSNKEFTFKVEVSGIKEVKEGTGAVTNKPEDQTVKIFENNEVKVTTNSPKTYVFQYEGDEPPTFSVTETDDKDSRIKSITSTAKDSEKVGENGVKGTLDPDTEVIVTATNELPKEGKLEINKTFDNTIEKERIVTVGVTINIPENVEIEDENIPSGFKRSEDKKTLDGKVKLTIPAGETEPKNPWIGDFKWYGEGQLTYNVKEIEVEPKDEYKVTITNESGSIPEDSRKVGVIIKNTKVYKGQLEVNKEFTVNNSEVPYDRKVKFKVTLIPGENVQMDKNPFGDGVYEKTGVITVPAKETTGKWTSGEFKWYGDATLDYKIEELEVTEDGKDVTAFYEASFDKQEGTLSDKVTVNMKNDLSIAYLNIHKDWNGTDENKEFDFEVNVDNVIGYKEVSETDEIIYAKDATPLENEKYYNESVTIHADKTKRFAFIYKGETPPTYSVEEKEISDPKVKFKSIVATGKYEKPNDRTVTGELEEDKTVTVTAENEEDHENKINIKKTLSKEAATDEIFVFKINVKNNGNETNEYGAIFVEQDKKQGTRSTKLPDEFNGENLVELLSNGTLPKVESWAENGVYTTQPYSWLASQETPTYEITEPHAYGLIGNTYVPIDGKYKPTFKPSSSDGKSSSGELNGRVTEITTEVKNNNTSKVGTLSINKVFDNKSSNERTVTVGVLVEIPANVTIVSKPDQLVQKGQILDGNIELTIPAGKNNPTEQWKGEFKWYNNDLNSTEDVNLPYHVTELKVTEKVKDDAGKIIEVKDLIQGQDYKSEITTTRDTISPTSAAQVTINNYTPRTGKLKITKIFDENDPNIAYDRMVKCKVDIRVKPQYAKEGEPVLVEPLPEGFSSEGLINGEYYQYSGVASFIVPANQTTIDPPWESGEFKWYGNENVEYEVSELDVIKEDGTSIKDFYKPSITKQKGTLSDTVEVKIENKLKIVYLDIHKKWLGNETDKKFSFNVEVDNVIEYKDDLGADEKIENWNGGKRVEDGTTYKATVEIPANGTKRYAFIYKGDKVPEYKIQEIIAENTRLNNMSAEREDGKKYKDFEYSKQDHFIKGKLVDNVHVIVTAENEEQYNNTLSITKELSGERAATDEIFTFEIIVNNNGKEAKEYGAIKVKKGETTGSKHVTMPSDYKGKNLKAFKAFLESEDDVWQDGGTYESKSYSWWYSDETPTFKIEEKEAVDGAYNNIFDKYVPSITHSEGKLDGQVAKINVNALNSRAKTLTIHKKFDNVSQVNRKVICNVKLIANGVSEIALPQDENCKFSQDGKVITGEVTLLIEAGSKEASWNGTFKWVGDGTVTFDEEGFSEKVFENEQDVTDQYKPSHKVSGDFSSEQVVTVEMDNKKIHKGHLEVTKQFEADNKDNANVPYARKVTFKVTVEPEKGAEIKTVPDGFKQNKNGKYETTTAITVPANETTGKWTSGDFEWYGGDVKYTAEELKVTEVKADGKDGKDLTEFYEASIPKKEGKLSDTVEITMINKLNIVYLYIHKDKYGIGDITGKEFSFDVKVDNVIAYKEINTDKEKVDLLDVTKLETFNNDNKPVKISVGGTKRYAFIYKGSKVPEYRVEELDRDSSDVRFKSITATGDSKTENRSVSGNFEKDVEVTVTALNEGSLKTSIPVTKEISRESDKDEIFTFEIIVDNNGKEAKEYGAIKVIKGKMMGSQYAHMPDSYDGTNLKDVIGKIEWQDGPNYVSKTYSWWPSEGAPTFKVEEKEACSCEIDKYVEDLKAKYNPSISHEKVTLDKNTTEVSTIKIVNTAIPHKGSLVINKKFDDVSEVDRDVVCDVTIKTNGVSDVKLPDGFSADGKGKVTLHIKKGSEEASWTGEFEWYGNGELTYEVKEREVKEAGNPNAVTKEYDVTITNGSGKISDSSNVNVKIDNKKIRKGHLSVTKTFKDKIKDKRIVNFKVTLTPRKNVKMLTDPVKNGFKLNENGKYEKSDCEIIVENGESTTWTSGDLEWTGGDVEYEVTELKVTQNGKDVTKLYKPSFEDENRSGILSDKVTVKMINMPNIVYLNINKNWTGDEIYKDTMFKFKVKVENIAGYIEVTDGKDKVSLEDIPLLESGTTFEKVIEVSANTPKRLAFVFKNGQQPVYEVQEIIDEKDPNVIFNFNEIKATSFTNTGRQKTDPVTGALSLDRDVTVTAYNEQIYKNGIKIEKETSRKVETDEIFAFEIIVDNNGKEAKEYGAIKVKRGEQNGSQYAKLQGYNGENLKEVISSATWINGSEYVSDQYEWKASQNNPKYEVREMDKAYSYENGEYTEIADEVYKTIYDENRKGTISSKDPKVTKVQNRHINIKQLQITKTIDGGVAETKERFDFDVTITKTDGTTETKPLSVFVNPGETTGTAVTTDEYKWYDKENVPSFKVDNEKAYSIDDAGNETDITDRYNPQGLPKEGKFNDVEDAVINVDVVNKIPEYVVLDLTKLANKDGTFEFTLRVENITGVKLIDNYQERGKETLFEGTEERNIKIKAGTTQEVIFKYNKGDNPTFTLKETDSSAALVKIESNHPELVSELREDGKLIGAQGTLKGYSTEEEAKKDVNKIKVIATNQFDGNYISITKMRAGHASKDEVFVFKVDVEGHGTTYAAAKVEKNKEEATMYATLKENNKEAIKNAKWQVGSSWISEYYAWNANEPKPKYTIEEINAYEGNELTDEGNELTDITSKYKPTINNSSGTLDGTGLTIHVDVLNNTRQDSAYLKISKKMGEHDILKPTFNFTVTITPDTGMELIGNTEQDGKIIEHVTITAGEEKVLKYSWTYTGNSTDIVPHYEVVENDSNFTLASIIVDGVALDKARDSNSYSNRSVSGKLIKAEEDDTKVTVVDYVNTGEKKGRIKVTKTFTEDKTISGAKAKDWAENNGISFKALITVKAATDGLLYDAPLNEEQQKDENGNDVLPDNFGKKEKTIELTLSKDNGWTAETEEIYWAGGNPTYTVQEIDIPSQYDYVSTKYEINGKNPETNEEITETKENIDFSEELKLYKTENEPDSNLKSLITITNKPRRAIALTMQLGGKVWEDKVSDKKSQNSKEDGVYGTYKKYTKDDNGQSVPEPLMKNIQVNIYKNIYNKSADEISLESHDIIKTTRTDENGRWTAQKLPIPVVSDENKYADYDVEFVYDGQTYEPTKPLASGSVTEFSDKNATKTDREKYENDSMAIETSNNSDKIVEVKGGTAMQDDGTTVGTVDYAGSEKAIYYDKTDHENPATSILQTTKGVDDVVQEEFKATASTSAEGLTFPFNMEKEDGIELSNVDGFTKLSSELKVVETNVDLMGVADRCWQYIVNKNPEYGWGNYVDENQFSTNTSDAQIDCSTFISWLLCCYGKQYDINGNGYSLYEEFKGVQHGTTDREANGVYSDLHMDFTSPTNHNHWKNDYGWEILPVVQDENVAGRLQAGDILVRDNGQGEANGHIAFVKSIENGIILYDCGNDITQKRWSSITGCKNDKFIVADKSDEHYRYPGYIIRIPKKEPVTLNLNGGQKYQISVDSNSVYDLYSKDGDTYNKITDKTTAVDREDYYIKNRVANYIVDNAGNYIIPQGSKYVKVHKEGGKYTIDPNENFVITENYKAIYNYCNNINLGLKNRKTVDLSLKKDLVSATVVVREKMYQFNWRTSEPSNNSLSQEISEDSLFQQGNDNTISADNALKLGLYKSDYYYRAEIYDGKVYDKYSDSYYKTLNKSLDDTEMDIYLKYKITVTNNSTKYNAKINSIVDYYDRHLELVRADESKYLQTKKIGSGGTENPVNNIEKVAEKSAYSEKWQDIEKNIEGIDGVFYNKMVAEDLDIQLAQGGNSQEFYLTFKVKKDMDRNSIILGQTANIAEIGSYSTSYANNAYDYDEESDEKLPKDYYATKSQKKKRVAGKNAGKIDMNSAPDNVNLRIHNQCKVKKGDNWEYDKTLIKKYWEDDTDSAPVVNIQTKGDDTPPPSEPEPEPDPDTTPGSIQDRTINGTVWEDRRTLKEKVKEKEKGYLYGNGIKQDDENPVNNLTTELVEKVMVPNEDGTYTAYDFVWPTDKPLASLGNDTIEKVTGFKGTTTTDNDGNYTFGKVPTGDYVVKFTYGDKEIETAKYNGKNSPKFYNGQDYKSSIYNLKDGDSEYVLNLDNYNNQANDYKNIAVDSEVRRLQVIQNSREITYNNSKVLASSYDDKYSQYENDLLKDYYMFAETPIIRFDLDKSYNLNNIDFALEERPLTELYLDKQIKEILVTTSDGKTLMDAVYNINYDIDDGKVTASVTADPNKSVGLENLQALNRDSATNNGFRYVNVDSEVLQGATITVKYQFALINAGEIDYTGKLAGYQDGTEFKSGMVKVGEDIFDWDKGGFAKVCEDLSTKLATYKSDRKGNTTETKQGQYVGEHYYYYGKGNGDNVVTTTVRELVDYVDNDVTFDSLLNSSENSAWKSSSEYDLKELLESKEEIKDKNGLTYSKSGNLITSINDSSKNKNLMKQLTPQSENNIATIDLTVSKFVSADSKELQIDNIAEIIRYRNTVGRRDILAVTGNTNPTTVFEKLENTKDANSPTTISGGYVPTLYERDTSVTETTTMIPPTGSSIFIWRLQVAGAIAFSMAIVAGGIILIKKKVLK